MGSIVDERTWGIPCNGQNVLVFGPWDTGKTHLLRSLVRSASSDGYEVTVFSRTGEYREHSEVANVCEFPRGELPDCFTKANEPLWHPFISAINAVVKRIQDGNRHIAIFDGFCLDRLEDLPPEARDILMGWLSESLKWNTTFIVTAVVWDEVSEFLPLFGQQVILPTKTKDTINGLVSFAFPIAHMSNDDSSVSDQRSNLEQTILALKRGQALHLVNGSDYRLVQLPSG